MKSFKVLLSFFLLTSQLLATHIFYVKTAEYGGNDSNDGRSWSTAYADVQKAIDAAAEIATEAEPAQVWIAKGTYTDAGGFIFTAYVMRNNVEIYGGFAETETKLEERVSGNETILTTTGNYVFYNSYSPSNKLTNTAKLDSVTILRGRSGGICIYNSYASPTITNCTISGNGSGIYNSYASPRITNCTISDNHYGIENLNSSSPMITNCTISGNGYYGIYNSSSNPTITHCTIYGNDGDGIYNLSSSSPTITNCTISDNAGNGISNGSSDTMIINCTITENKEQGISNTSSSLMIINCIIWGNTLQQIYNSSFYTPIVSYCVIEGGYSSGTNIITEDPLLGELGNYGGSVYTIIIAKGSSAIGKGTSSGAPEEDARGIMRLNPPCIGAFEASTEIPTAVSIVAKEVIIVGKETEVIAYSDGNPDEYILYKDGVEIARQDTNVFKITPTESGYHKYSVGIIYDGNIIMSKNIKEVRQILGNIIYVKEDGNDSRSGDSWDNALLDVQKAIDAAASLATDVKPIQVWIAKGTYTNAGGIYNYSTELNTTYAMRNNVEIYGGFAETETKLEERVSGNETILTTTGNYVFYNSSINNTAKLDSVTITGAVSSGISNSFSSPTITNCTISGNDCYGIYNSSYSNPRITNCTISGNGSGIDNSSSDPRITNCTISGNGRGIYNSSYSNPTITNCTISGNDGDGINNWSSSSPTITNCTIFGNAGNCIYNSSSSPTIINCIIWGNASQQIYNYSSSTSIVSYCVIKGGYPDGTNIITEDPLLGELGNYGGFVDVIPVLKGSSAIGAGTTGENIPTTDARGVNRANPPTIGAYEYFVQTSFDVWAQDNNLTGENAKPEAIPHSDGITNLEKFTFGLDASKATSYAESGLFKQISYGTNVSFQYPVNKAATDVAVKALVSEDLVHWTEATATESGESGNMNIFEIKKPIPESGKLFFKVEINQ